MTAIELPSIGTRSGWVAGLNHGYHDASCALLHDGSIVAVVEQERLSRRKRAVDEPPADALAHCLATAGIGLDDLDLVALGSDHERLTDWLGEPPAAVDLEAPERLYPEALFGGGPRPPTIRVPHHLAHAASAAWPSGLDEPGILVMDAMGEDSSTVIARLGPDGVEILESLPIDGSLGYFYEAAAEYCGLGRDAAGKLMGLAAYGLPCQDVGLRLGAAGLEWPQVRTNGKRGRAMIEDRIEQLLCSFEDRSFPHLRGCRADIMAYADFAASVQQALVRAVLDLARRARELTGARSLALAGGVALNCSANGALSDSRLFERVWIQPMANDAGVGLGAALVAAHALGDDVARHGRMEHAYWGPSERAEDVAAAFARYGLRPERRSIEAVAEAAAEVIGGGGVVAWHQGRAEVGPRALGARSFVGDPRSRASLVRLNRMKGREMWRPVAPSVLEDAFGEYFEGVPNEFMLVAARVRVHARRELPAIVHVDGSVRPQVVREVANPSYAALLRAVERRTGHPVVINTSLNVAGSPICCSAADTLLTFLESGADAVVIDDWVALR